MIEAILYKTAIYCRLSSDDGSLGDTGSIKTQKMMLEKYCADNNFSIKALYHKDDCFYNFYKYYKRNTKKIIVYAGKNS